MRIASTLTGVPLNVAPPLGTSNALSSLGTLKFALASSQATLNWTTGSRIAVEDQEKLGTLYVRHGNTADSAIEVGSDLGSHPRRSIGQL